MNRKDFLSGVITGFTVGVLVMAFIFMSTGCATKTEPPYVGPTPDAASGELILVGCADHVCVYRFQNPKTNLTCHFAVGSYPGFGGTWRFDLECP